MLPLALAALALVRPGWTTPPRPYRAPLALYTSDACVAHQPSSRTKPHPEQPERLANLLRALRTKWSPEFGARLAVREPSADVTDAQLLRVHSLAHTAKVELALTAAKGVGRVNLDSDTVASTGTRAAARRAAGLVVAAVDEVMQPSLTPPDRRPRRAFVMARPPGHHAEADKAMGICFYNNVLVGVAHAQAKHGVGRVAILDFDVHHGNGDAQISEVDPARLYVSSHEVPNFPGTGIERGTEGAFANVVSVPLPPGSGPAAFRRAWRDTLLPAVRAFEPEMIFLSAGFDAHKDDPLSSARLEHADFAWLTREVTAIGGGRLPIVSVLEGGYNIAALERSVYTHVKALMA